MITGSVFGRHALVTLSVRGPNGQGDVEFVLDTGFTGFLTLPPAVIAALGLPLINFTPATLADGSATMLSVHEIAVLWDGVERITEALAMDGLPLLGTSLLDGHEVIILFNDGGPVTIEHP